MTENWIIAERNSPSDEQLMCLEVLAQNGDFVSADSVVFEMEGAKAVFEVLAGSDGFFYSFVEKGQHILVGVPIVFVARDRLSDEEIVHWKINSSDNKKGYGSNDSKQLKMSNAAAKLYENLNHMEKKRVESEFADLNFVRESDLINYIESRKVHINQLSETSVNGWKSGLAETKGLPNLYFVGGGFGALQVLDVLLEKREFNVGGYFSDISPNLLDEIGVPRLGACIENDYVKVQENIVGSAFVITVGMSPIFRLKQTEILIRLGVDLPNVIHPSALIGRNLEIGVGNIIMGNVHIGADVRIGNGNFISSNSTIEHHNVLGSGNCFGPQIATSGNVTIGNICRFGSAIVVEPHIRIGSDVTIASNVTITSEINDRTTIKASSSPRYTSK